MPTYRSVRALQRGLAVLKATNTLAEPTVEAIARLTDLSWSTVFRLLETLEDAGYVSRSNGGHVYRPTVAARSLGESYERDGWVAELATPEIHALAGELLWPIDLLVFNNDTMLNVESTQRTSPFSIDRNMVGQRVPVVLTSAGRAYLANVSEAERRSIVERLARKQDQEGEFVRHERKLTVLLKRTHEQGYGSREGGLFPHTKSVSVPIIVADRVVGCIGVTWIASAITMAEGASRFADPLRTAAMRIGSRLDQRSHSAPPH